MTDKDAEEKLVDHLCFSTYLRCRRDHAQDSIVSAQVKWRDDESKKVFQLDFDLGKGEKDTVERAVFSACRPLVGKFNGCPRKVFSTLLAYVKEKLELREAMRWETGNHYEILDVATDSSAALIKKSYRRLSVLYHPDKNKDDSAHQKFLKIRDAYECLADQDRRYKYDISTGIKKPAFQGFRFGNRFIRLDGRGGVFIVI